MPIDPKDMVAYAFSLYEANQSNSNNEMIFRAIVNRAYYGAFLTARDHAGIKDRKGSVHQDVAAHYQSKNIGLVGNNLDELKRLRQIADYEPESTIGVRHAKSSCTKAKTILSTLNK